LIALLLIKLIFDTYSWDTVVINIKTLFFGAAFFIAGYSLNLFTHENSLYSVPTTKNSNESSILQLSQCENKNLELTKHINEIVKINNYASSNITTPITSEKKQEKASQEKSESAQDLKSQLTILSNYYIENELKKHQEFLNSIKATPENISQALNDNFKKDTYDATWSPEQKSKIDDFISRSPHLSALPNIESDCKSARCKISILSDDQNTIEQVSSNINMLASANGFESYTFAIDDKTHSLSIYLDRTRN
jgi:ribosomal protein S10